MHRTQHSELQIAAGMEHVIDGPGRVEVDVDVRPDWARTTVICVVPPGERLRVVKYLAYGWSGLRSLPALRDQVGAALTGALYAGFEGLVQQQQDFLLDFWDSADVVVEGDAEIQQAVRFGLFHVLQAGARAERRAIPAKGLTGPGYDGHTFWDAEGFVLPVLTYTHPEAAADALRWRYSILDLARERAAELGLAGATFPWRTIRGQECSGYWPAGTAAFHVNADIAYAHERYRTATGDDSVEEHGGLEVLVETARLWMSLGHHDRGGRWHVDGVTGPDEYSAIVDDNVFTNLMAARNLRAAAEAVNRHPEEARRVLGVSLEESATWRAAADAVYLPFDEELGVHAQADLFTRYREWDFEASRGEVPAAAARAVLPAVPQPGGEAGRPGPRDPLVRGRVHGRGEGARLRLLRAAHGPGLVPVRVHPGGGGGGDRPPGARPRLRVRGGHSSTSSTLTATPVTACTWPRWPAAGSRSWPASGACATTKGCCRSPRRCPSGSRACRSACAGTATGCGST